MHLSAHGVQDTSGIENYAQVVFLEFATNFTAIMEANSKNATWASSLMYEQTDLGEGTYPEGSVWRPIGVSGYHALRRDKVIVPSNLTPGDYVLGWRWDVAEGLAQVTFFEVVIFFIFGNNACSMFIGLVVLFVHQARVWWI